MLCVPAPPTTLHSRAVGGGASRPPVLGVPKDAGAVPKPNDADDAGVDAPKAPNPPEPKAAAELAPALQALLIWLTGVLDWISYYARTAHLSQS